MSATFVGDLKKLQSMGAIFEILYEHFNVKPLTTNYDYTLEKQEPTLLGDTLSTGSGEGASPVKNNHEM